MNFYILLFINFVVIVGGVFVFGYKVIEYIFSGNNVFLVVRVYIYLRFFKIYFSNIFVFYNYIIV